MSTSVNTLAREPKMMTKVISDMMNRMGGGSLDGVNCREIDGLYLPQKDAVDNTSYTAMPCGAASHIGAARLESLEHIYPCKGITCSSVQAKVRCCAVPCRQGLSLIEAYDTSRSMMRFR